MNRKTKKILAGIVGAALILLLLSFANSLVGNPISSQLATSAAQKYITTNYSDLDLKIADTSYNFKFNRYEVLVESPTSIDMIFRINVNNYGGVISDDYEYEVANNFTTLRRLENELREIAKETIGSQLDYDIDYLSLSFIEDDTFLLKFKRDMKLDIQHPPLPLMINVDLYDSDVSYEKIAEVTKALQRLLEKQSIPVKEYSLRIIPLSNRPQQKDQAASWAGALSVSNFPAERLNDQNLPQAMEQFEAAQVDKINETDK